MEGELDYPRRLNQLINLLIDYDLPDVIPVTLSTRTQLKKTAQCNFEIGSIYAQYCQTGPNIGR